VALRALDDVARLEDRLFHAKDLLALVPGLVGVEVDAEGREEDADVGGDEALANAALTGTRLAGSQSGWMLEDCKNVET